MVGRIFLGRYETIRLLGEGGMGRVYLARQIDLGRQVVVKVMHEHIASDPKFRDRFQREMLLMAQYLQHPYIVTLYDASLNDPEGPCIVMEYIRGVSLDNLLLRNGRLNPSRISRLLEQLCEALQAAHDKGIIHRDLKPANLMVVDPDTPYEKIKVMDFGLAKMVDAPARPLEHISDTGVDFAVGTPGYISPEQVRGDGMDHRSDLYSVGVILYELLTGKLPFSGGETMDVLLAHATEEPPTFAQAGVPDLIPPAIEEVVRRCLAKNPGHRPQSARELADLYEQALVAEQLSVPQSILATTLVTAPLQGAKLASEQRTPTVRPGAPNPEEQATPPPQATPSNSASAPSGWPAIEEDDPNLVVHHLEAWMPEKIAVYKLRGFMDDVGGQVLENVPGRILVRLGGKGSIYQMPPLGPLSWLGLGRRHAFVDMELRLERKDPQQSLLHITVVMRSSDSNAAANPLWRERCNQIFCDLRGYLMGSGPGLAS